MLSQPRMHSLDNPTAYLAGLALLLLGGVLVLSSFFALGFTGTFLGKTPRAGGLETTHSRSRGEAGAADCPAARDVCVSLRPPSLLQASACAWLAQEAGLSYLIQQLGCQPRQGISVLCLGHKPAACGGAWLSGGLGPGSRVPPLLSPWPASGTRPQFPPVPGWHAAPPACLGLCVPSCCCGAWGLGTTGRSRGP